MKIRETRCVGTVEIRSVEGEPSKIRGLAAPYYDGTPGTQYRLWEGAVERYAPGAFDDAIKNGDVRILFNHNSDIVLGRTSAGTAKLWASDRGLEYEATPPDTTTARDVLAMLARGDVTGSSVGMIVERDSWVRENGTEVRTIHKAMLLDVSPVTFPAYDGTAAHLRSMEAVREELAKVQREREEEHARGLAMMDAELAMLDT